MLWDEEMYGLEVQKKVSIFGYKVTSGQLYPALRRLEDNGCVSSVERTRVGANRKYYRITETGKEYLIENVLDQIKILEILAAKNMSGVLLESGFISVGEGDAVVEFSDVRFMDVVLSISSKVGDTGSYTIVAGDDRESSLLREWTALEEIDDKVTIVQREGKSVGIDSGSADLALILFRMHLDDSSWMLAEAKRVIADGGRVVIFDLLDREDDFRSDFYGGVLPGHSKMGVRLDELYEMIEENEFRISREVEQKGLLLMTLENPGSGNQGDAR